MEKSHMERCERCEFCHEIIEGNDLLIMSKFAAIPNLQAIILCIGCSNKLDMLVSTATENAEKLFYYECLDKSWPRD